MHPKLLQPKGCVRRSLCHGVKSIGAQFRSRTRRAGPWSHVVIAWGSQRKGATPPGDFRAVPLLRLDSGSVPGQTPDSAHPEAIPSRTGRVSRNGLSPDGMQLNWARPDTMSMTRGVRSGLRTGIKRGNRARAHKGVSTGRIRNGPQLSRTLNPRTCEGQPSGLRGGSPRGAPRARQRALRIRIPDSPQPGCHGNVLPPQQLLHMPLPLCLKL